MASQDRAVGDTPVNIVAADATITPAWDALSDGTTYTIQNTGTDIIHIAAAASVPSGLSGFIKRSGESLGFKPVSGEGIWVRTANGGSTKISVIASS